jgi:hypothetical protein
MKRRRNAETFQDERIRGRVGLASGQQLVPTDPRPSGAGEVTAPSRRRLGRAKPPAAIVCLCFNRLLLIPPTSYESIAGRVINLLVQARRDLRLGSPSSSRTGGLAETCGFGGLELVAVPMQPNVLLSSCRMKTSAMEPASHFESIKKYMGMKPLIRRPSRLAAVVLMPPPTRRERVIRGWINRRAVCDRISMCSNVEKSEA